MLGICFDSVQHVSVHQLADPVLLDDDDAIIGVQTAGLCGSDFHPFFGRETGLDSGTVMGHEFVGEVIAVGANVKTSIGTRVCAPFTTNCGECFYCLAGLTSRCEHSQLFGWRQNETGLHGGQAAQVRVPHADATLVAVPDTIDNGTALLVGDNLSTGRFCADLVGIQPNSIYAVVGCGTVGLMAILSAIRLGAQQVFAVDPVAARRELATSLGAIALDPTSVVAAVHDATGGRGADGVMELVGLPAAQELAYQLIRPGGTMSVIGCHCTPNFAFSPSDAYDKNLTYRTGRCPARHFMPTLFEELAATPLVTDQFVTHHFSPSECMPAYEMMSQQKNGCVKAVFDF